MSSRPNILLILTDQQRWDTLGCGGNAQIQMPHLDALAADGVLFPHSFCSFPVCTPSRYSLLSGLYVHQHGGWSNRCTLAPGLPTFPRLLRQAGYSTAAVGKMHFTPTYLDVGFDRLELAEQDGEGRLEDDYHRELKQAGLLDLLDLVDQRAEFRERAPQEYWRSFGAQTSDLPEEWHSTTWIAERALREIDGWGEGGSLLAAGFIKPHHPFDPPAPWDAMYDPDSIEPPASMPGLDLADENAERPFVFASAMGRRHAVRSRTHKLMLARGRQNCAFFDLENDPLEMEDLFDEPQAQPLIEQHWGALADWMLFEAPGPVYLDEDAPQIAAPNVLARGGSHRAEMTSYFEARARERLSPPRE